MTGFTSLSAPALRRVIATYEAAIASSANYPCGICRRAVQRWLRQARIALAAQEA
jgi:cytidine deaminase